MRRDAIPSTPRPFSSHPGALSWKMNWYSYNGPLHMVLSLSCSNFNLHAASSSPFPAPVAEQKKKNLREAGPSTDRTSGIPAESQTGRRTNEAGRFPGRWTIWTSSEASAPSDRVGGGGTVLTSEGRRSECSSNVFTAHTLHALVPKRTLRLVTFNDQLIIKGTIDLI